MTEQHDNGLIIVPAGAGAGKTHRIKTTLADWVKRGLVRPERILAVTFTETAASELRERIRAGLLSEGLVEEALAVERAYVSTIHGLGLRLLTEHALAAGASPKPRHLGDAERDLLIRQTLAHAKSLDPIKADPERFGYTANFVQDASVEDVLRKSVLSMIELLRGLGDPGRNPDLIAPALARLDYVYGPALADPVIAARTLVDAVAAMLASFPEGGAATISAVGPRKALEDNLALFNRVSRNPTALERDWRLWQALRKLTVSNSKSKTPPGYDALAEDIVRAADVLPQHPGPLADAKLHLSCLIACAQEVMDAYEAKKRSYGLIDYADMITGAERLLRTDPAVLDAILGEVDCVIIDEFQDTNPVQFALLWQLGSRAPRTLLVGDVKQSIMGFQGADPRLSRALAGANNASIRPLEHNWRSTPAIMEIVNAIGSGLFGEEYHHLAPTRAAVEGAAVEVLHLTKSRGVVKYSKPQEHVAERIARMLKDAETVTDRHSAAVRTVRPSDIALLVYRHSTAVSYAKELRRRGVPVRINENGWSASPIIQAARAALFYAANRSDLHAALLLRALGPDCLPLEEALSLAMDDQLSSDPRLSRLSALSDEIVRMPASAALDIVLEASGIRLWADGMPDAAQARADLLRLEGEAIEFERSHRDLKAASGFHGETIKVFLGWLESRTNDRDFDRHPDPSGDVAEAVEIVTWHASKGREWPITVVAEFDNGITERAGTSSVQFSKLDRIDDMDEVLRSAEIIHTPNFAAPEALERFVEDRREDFEANARNLLYVALTRARDRLILEWPVFLKEREAGADCLFHIFEDACKPLVNTDTLTIRDTEHPVRHVYLPEIAPFTELNVGEIKQPTRFGREAALAKIPLTPWRIQPSLLTTVSPLPASQTVVIGDPWPATVSNSSRGTALHVALRTYLIRPDLAGRIGASVGLDEVTLDLVRRRAQALKLWLKELGLETLICEMQVMGKTSEGAEIPGIIDLVAVGPNGCMIIDHKSGGSGKGLDVYWPQLSAYINVLPTIYPDLPLLGAAVFWLDHGRLELVELQGAVPSAAASVA